MEHVALNMDIKTDIVIIGAGPAGMACAEELRKSGYQVTIYDRYDRPGGLLIYGIPNFKLEKFVVERRTKLLKESGIKFVQNFEVGKDKSLYELKKKHDAILIATGVYKAREIDIPGHNLKNIFPAMDFLTASNRKGLGDKVKLFDDGTLNAEGKNVVVIGGGMTAIDAAVQSKLLGAEEVTLVYRGSQKKMPASQYEQEIAKSKGVRIIFNAKPVSIGGSTSVEHIEFEQTENGSAANKNFSVKTDHVLKAIGQLLTDEPQNLELEGSKIKVNALFETSVKNVWAGGDCVSAGDDLTVTAVAQGRDAAENIHSKLMGEG